MSGDQRRSFFVSGGTLPADSASYIERSTDADLPESLMAGRFCYVLNSRQLGKSSLSVHTITLLQRAGVRTAFIDLTRIGGKSVTPEQWYSGIAMEIARELDCRRDAVKYWKENVAAALVQRLFGFIRGVALARSETPLVIFVDEIDATRSLPFDPDEFFAAIRECYNRRVSDPAFEKLTFCLLGVAVPSDLVRNRATTPFNIGERITLQDFTQKELSAFAPHLGPNGKAVIARVHYWTGGHPYLSQSLCRSIATLGGIDDARKVDALVRRELFDYKARDSNINLADVANIALHYGENEGSGSSSRADLLSIYDRILSGKEVIDDEANRAIVLLKLSGIVRTDGRKLSVRNRIYKRVFNRKWIREHMPEQELRRQEQSYRRGAWRTAIAAGTILALATAGTAIVWYSRAETLQAQAKLNYQLYVADMNSLRHFYDNGDTARIETILNRHRNSPYRGFEWGYWLGRYHDSPEEYSLAYNAPGKRAEGHISTDQTQICLVDNLSLTATIIDRRSKRVLVTRKIDSPLQVVPLRSRWTEVRREGSHYRVVDLITGETHCMISEPQAEVLWTMPIEHSDFVLAGEGSFSENAPKFIVVWNAETGKKVASFINRWNSPVSLNVPGSINLSVDGRFITYPVGPAGRIESDPDKALGGEQVVVDIGTRKVVDRFPSNQFVVNGTRGFQGNYVLYNDRAKSFVRNISTHKSTQWNTSLLTEWRVGSRITSGNTLVTLLDGGRCIVSDLAGQRPDISQENVNYVAPGASSGEYLASASTVRLYDADSLANATTVASGRRVTRYSDGVINIFNSGIYAIARVDENTLRTVGTVPLVGDGGAYTYGGRWYMAKAQVLREVEDRFPPIPLPFVPSIWSSGQSADSIALWSSQKNLLMGFSGSRGRPRWTKSDVAGVNALWVSPDGSRLFASIGDRRLSVFDMADGRLLGKIHSHNVGLVFLTFTDGGKRMFTCGGDGSAVMWDVHSLEKLMEFRGNDQDGMTSADLSPDGRRVVTTTRSGSWQLWDAANGVQLLDVHVSAGSLSSAIFRSDGREIITAGDDGQVRIWRSVESDPTAYIPISDSYLSNLHR